MNKGASVGAEFRVIWKRAGTRVKERRFVREARAERWLGLLTSDEPWRFYGRQKNPDEPWCCRGSIECDCGGITIREKSEELRQEMPTLEYARIERRTVTAWCSLDSSVPSPKKEGATNGK